MKRIFQGMRKKGGQGEARGKGNKKIVRRNQKGPIEKDQGSVTFSNRKGGRPHEVGRPTNLVPKS